MFRQFQQRYFDMMGRPVPQEPLVERIILAKAGTAENLGVALVKEAFAIQDAHD